MSLSNEQLEQIKNATNDELEKLIKVPTETLDQMTDSEAWDRVQLSKQADYEKLRRLHDGDPEQKRMYIQKLQKAFGRVKWNPGHVRCEPYKGGEATQQQYKQAVDKHHEHAKHVIEEQRKQLDNK